MMPPQVLGRFGLLLLVGVLVGCGNKTTETQDSVTDVAFSAEGVLDFQRADSTIITRIVIELAETVEEQAQGLMFRRSLPERGGMLFIGSQEEMKSFWMKNTALSLDILFVDSEGEIVNIVKNTPPFSEEFILSTAPAQYVVEVRSGFTDRYAITEADRITWRRETFETDTQ
jgi:uncharacterized membrane protein (UPF0127 family)